MTPSHFPQDTQDLLLLLQKYGVRYLIVGAEAVIFYGYARLTGDVDIYFDPSRENREKLFINAISGLDFQEAWASRVSQDVQIRDKAVKVPYIGLAALIKNKESCGRPKDLDDLSFLRAAAKKAD